ncbi:Hsp70 family protein [Glycomyces artemisiae]|uniref:Hsp70 protein n=1 Tax=Glycomyces artemisiae TaxID=1076443 RepID=A0A2T0UMN5_9ACTN|nr:Hsp70 family protein [Glycomyces artemisiae]PRY59182.1 Hsp70 protein [Glycomyces artemisiae]
MSLSSPRPASISIDFGTSHTVATIRRADGRVHQQLFDGSPQLPSAVYIDDEDGPVVGADAVHSGRRKPERFEPNPKRRIDDAQLLLGDTEIPVTSVVAAVLSRVARECEQTLGSLGPVTVTVPAAWGPTRRHVVIDAAAAAGLGAVDLVAEPVAAVSYFMESLRVDVRPGNGVVVYDLGGGTFDATVLRRSASGFDVLAVDGADDLGGLDFDQALAEYLEMSVQPDDDRWQRLTNPAEPAAVRHRIAFMDEVRQAKERLSRSASTDLTIPLLDIDVHLTRGELELVCAPLVERTIRITQGVIRESGLAKEQISGIFLVGAASRMPLVATLLHRELAIAPAAIEQPELAVSEGGLVAQHTISTPISVPSPALPPQTSQTMPLPSPSAPRPVSQPTPQSAPPGHSTSPHSQMRPAAPVGSGSWFKTRPGVTVLSAAAVMVILSLAALVLLQFLPDKEDGDLTTGGGAQTEDTLSTHDSSADASEDPLADSALGDLVVTMGQAHVGAVYHVRTGQIDGVPVAVTGGEDSLIRVWNLATGEPISTFQGHQDGIEHLSVFDYEGRSVVFSRDSSTEAVWYLEDPDNPVAFRESGRNTIYWVGIRGSDPVYVTDHEVHHLLTGEVVGDVALAAADFSWLTYIDDTFTQVGTYQNRMFTADTATGDTTGRTFDQLDAEVIAFALGGAHGKVLGLTVTGDGSVQAWDLSAAAPYGTAGHESHQAVNAAQLFELDGKAVALLQGDKGLTLHDLDTGEPIGETFAPHTGDAALTSTATGAIDGHSVVVTGTMAGEVQVWSL